MIIMTNKQDPPRISQIFKYIPNPAVSANIRITFPISSKARALAAATLTLCAMTTSKTVLANFGTPGMHKGGNKFHKRDMANQ